eukprot:scaffold13603_cov112-Isochrysis_galbana.AAC.8
MDTSTRMGWGGKGCICWVMPSAANEGPGGGSSRGQAHMSSLSSWTSRVAADRAASRESQVPASASTPRALPSRFRQASSCGSTSRTPCPRASAKRSGPSRSS